jgi:hypothetical protein
MSSDDQCDALDVFKSEEVCQQEAEEFRSSILPLMAISGMGFATTLIATLVEKPEPEQNQKPRSEIESDTLLTLKPEVDKISKDSSFRDTLLLRERLAPEMLETNDENVNTLTTESSPSILRQKKTRTPEEQAVFEKTVKVAKVVSVASGVVFASSLTMSNMVDTTCEDAESQDIRIECEDRAHEKYQTWSILSITSGLIFVSSSFLAWLTK